MCRLEVVYPLILVHFSAFLRQGSVQLISNMFIALNLLSKMQVSLNAQAVFNLKQLQNSKIG